MGFQNVTANNVMEPWRQDIFACDAPRASPRVVWGGSSKGMVDDTDGGVVIEISVAFCCRRLFAAGVAQLHMHPFDWVVCSYALLLNRVGASAVRVSRPGAW